MASQIRAPAPVQSRQWNLLLLKDATFLLTCSAETVRVRVRGFLAIFLHKRIDFALCLEMPPSKQKRFRI